MNNFLGRDELMTNNYSERRMTEREREEKMSSAPRRQNINTLHLHLFILSAYLPDCHLKSVCLSSEGE
jgi:hypothetical protein